MEFGPFTIRHEFIFYQTDLSFAFTNLSPALEGHCLVSPKRRVQYFSQLSYDEKIDLIKTGSFIAEVLSRNLGKSGFSLTIQDGPVAGQTVSHVHMHIIPRDFPTQWKPLKNIPDDIRSETTAKYRGFFI